MSPIIQSKHNFIKVVYNHSARRKFKTKITVLLRTDKEYKKEKNSFLRIRKLKQKIEHLSPETKITEIPSKENDTPVIAKISNDNNKLSHQEVLDKILSIAPSSIFGFLKKSGVFCNSCKCDVCCIVRFGCITA